MRLNINIRRFWSIVSKDQCRKERYLEMFGPKITMISCNEHSTVRCKWEATSALSLSHRVHLNAIHLRFVRFISSNGIHCAHLNYTYIWCRFCCSNRMFFSFYAFFIFAQFKSFEEIAATFFYASSNVYMMGMCGRAN